MIRERERGWDTMKEIEHACELLRKRKSVCVRACGLRAFEKREREKEKN